MSVSTKHKKVCKKMMLYGTEDYVFRDMQRINSRKKLKLTRPYYCDECRGYHLTSQTREKTRNNKKKHNESK